MQCQVQGCDADLVADGKYSVKRRLCKAHLQAEAVTRRNHNEQQLWRFCQQCGKLEPLQCFEGSKRSCKAALAKRREGARKHSPDRSGKTLNGNGSSSSSAIAAAAPASPSAAVAAAALGQIPGLAAAAAIPGSQPVIGSYPPCAPMTTSTPAHTAVYASPAAATESAVAAAVAAAACGPRVSGHLPSSSSLSNVDHVAEVAALKQWLTQQSQELEAKQMMLQQRWQYLQHLSQQQGQRQHCQELDGHRHQVQLQMDGLRQQLNAMQAQQPPWQQQQEQLAQAASDLNGLEETGKELVMHHPRQPQQPWLGLDSAGIAELAAAPQQQQFAALLSALKAASNLQQQQQVSIANESSSESDAALAALLGAVTASAAHTGQQRQQPAQGPQRAGAPSLQGLLDVMQAATSAGDAQVGPSARPPQHSQAPLDAPPSGHGRMSRAPAGGMGLSASPGWLHHQAAHQQPPDAAGDGGTTSGGDVNMDAGDDCCVKVEPEQPANAMSVDPPSSADMPDALAPFLSMLRNMSNSSSASFTLGSIDLTDMLEATLAEAQRNQVRHQQQVAWQPTPNDGEFDMKRHNSFNSRPYQRPRLAADNNSTVQVAALLPSTAGGQSTAGSTASNGWSNLDALSAAAAALAAAEPQPRQAPSAASAPQAEPTIPAGKADDLLLQQVQQLLVAAGAVVGGPGSAGGSGAGAEAALPTEMDAAAVLRAALS